MNGWWNITSDDVKNRGIQSRRNIPLMAHRTVEINSNLPFLFTSGEKYLTGITATAMHALVRYIEANVALFLPDTHAVKLVKKILREYECLN